MNDEKQPTESDFEAEKRDAIPSSVKEEKRYTGVTPSLFELFLDLLKLFCIAYVIRIALIVFLVVAVVVIIVLIVVNCLV